MDALPELSVVDLFLTYNCNCKCSYCFVQDSGSDIRMKPHILDKSIDWIVKHAGPSVQIVFLGGEPTLEPGLIERAVHRCKNWEKYYPVKFSFNMTTNSLNIDEPLAANLARWGIQYLFSIDGYGERHNKSRPARFTDKPFDIIRARFPMLKKYQQNMTARLTVLPSLVTGLCDDLVKLRQMGFDSFIVSPATGVRWTEDKLQQYTDEMVKFASQRPVNNGRPTPYISPIDDPVQGQNKWGCAAGRGRLSIDPQGKIFACGRMTCLDEKDGLAFGDIFNGIDLNGNINAFQDTSYESRLECLSCDLREQCIGGCAAVNWDDNRSPVKPSHDQCRFIHAFEETKRRVYPNQTVMPV
jgi:radical SAM protein with 4Fe4S-binding SPASM domain